MIKNWIISIVNKTNNKLLEKLTDQNKKIQELEKRIEDLLRSHRYRNEESRIDLIEWRIDNPAKYLIGDKVVTSKGTGIVCERSTNYSCPEGHSYYYFVIVKNKREYFNESELK